MGLVSRLAVTFSSGGDVFLDSRPLSSRPLFTVQPRNSRRARSAVVREQTGYRAAVSVGREHLIIAKMHARSLHNVFANIKDVSARRPFFSLSAPFGCALDRREKQR